MDAQLLMTPATAEEARALTDRIKQAKGQFERLVYEAHHRRAWAALRNEDGTQSYKSWSAYVEGEFKMSEQRSFQLLKFVEIKERISTQPGLSTPPLTEKQARPLAALPDEMQADAWRRAQEETGSEQPAAPAVREVVAKVIEEAQEEPAAPAKLPPYRPASGMQFAMMAITQLERIHRKDTEREAAFAKVETWIAEHR